MALLLGIDTGGTYTDAVLFDDKQSKVIAKAKSLTTRHDLAIGISGAVTRVIDAAKIDAATIELVSLSTTLATNALVEGQQRRIGLVMIGFSETDIQRQGLASALGNDPMVRMAGGHNVTGDEAAALILQRLTYGSKMLARRSRATPMPVISRRAIPTLTSACAIISAPAHIRLSHAAMNSRASLMARAARSPVF